MRSIICLAAAIASITTLGTVPAASASTERWTQPPSPPQGMRELDGEWIYVEDLTEGRALEQLGPPMSSKFSFRVEDGAIVLVSGHGSGHRDVRVPLDGSITEMAGTRQGDDSTTRYRAQWSDGTLATETDFVRSPGGEPEGLIRREFRPTADGLVVRVTTERNPSGSVGLYRHAEDIPMPTPAPAAIGDLTWLAGAWVGTRSSGSSVEERWSPPLGGAMLGVSRTVNTSGKMVGFEYLRIIERDGGLVYIAQPGGATPTEFVLSDLASEGGSRRATFDNPRHDYPKRIVYELSADGALSATIGFTKGGTPRRFDFKAESGKP